jgi:hypothetical protein
MKDIFETTSGKIATTTEIPRGVRYDIEDGSSVIVERLPEGSVVSRSFPDGSLRDREILTNYDDAISIAESEVFGR